jgi:hypothetical protein
VRGVRIAARERFEISEDPRRGDVVDELHERGQELWRQRLPLAAQLASILRRRRAQAALRR